jgi:hypothetical protein
MFTLPNDLKFGTMMQAIATGGATGFLLSLMVELSGLSMNWCDRLGSASFFAGLALIAVCINITLRKRG